MATSTWQGRPEAEMNSLAGAGLKDFEHRMTQSRAEWMASQIANSALEKSQHRLRLIEALGGGQRGECRDEFLSCRQWCSDGVNVAEARAHFEKVVVGTQAGQAGRLSGALKNRDGVDDSYKGPRTLGSIYGDARTIDESQGGAGSLGGLQLSSSGHQRSRGQAVKGQQGGGAPCGAEGHTGMHDDTSAIFAKPRARGPQTRRTRRASLELPPASREMRQRRAESGSGSGHGFRSIGRRSESQADSGSLNGRRDPFGLNEAASLGRHSNQEMHHGGAYDGGHMPPLVSSSQRFPSGGGWDEELWDVGGAGVEPRSLKLSSRDSKAASLKHEPCSLRPSRRALRGPQDGTDSANRRASRSPLTSPFRSARLAAERRYDASLAALVPEDLSGLYGARTDRPAGRHKGEAGEVPRGTKQVDGLHHASEDPFSFDDPYSFDFSSDDEIEEPIVPHGRSSRRSSLDAARPKAMDGLGYSAADMACLKVSPEARGPLAPAAIGMDIIQLSNKSFRSPAKQASLAQPFPPAHSQAVSSHSEDGGPASSERGSGSSSMDLAFAAAAAAGSLLQKMHHLPHGGGHGREREAAVAELKGLNEAVRARRRPVYDGESSGFESTEDEGRWGAVGTRLLRNGGRPRGNQSTRFECASIPEMHAPSHAPATRVASRGRPQWDGESSEFESTEDESARVHCRPRGPTHV